MSRFLTDLREYKLIEDQLELLYQRREWLENHCADDARGDIPLYYRDGSREISLEAKRSMLRETNRQIEERLARKREIENNRAGKGRIDRRRKQKRRKRW